MIPSIHVTPSPDWMLALTPQSIARGELPLGKILADSFYYPGSSIDVEPISLLERRVHSFVYADYIELKQGKLRESLEGTFVAGYKLLGMRMLRGATQLIPRNWCMTTAYESGDGDPEFFSEHFQKPFGCWAVLEHKDAPERRISLLFVASEGAKAFQALYTRNQVRPLAVAVIRTDGFAGNFTKFADSEKILGRSVAANPAGMPDLLLHYAPDADAATRAQSPWPAYTDRAGEGALADGGFLLAWHRSNHPFSEAERNSLMSFVGYGNPDGLVWFIGMEEAGGGEWNLRRRLEFTPVMDLREAHFRLGIHVHHDGARILQPTWAQMCRTMLLIAGQEDISKDPTRTYQAEFLGRAKGETFLTELMPLPKPTVAEWPSEYQRLFGWTRDEYYAHADERRELLRKLMEKHLPAVVICYGGKYWNHYRELFGNPKAVEVGANFEVLADSSRIVILTKHLSNKTMNDCPAMLAALIEARRPVWPFD